MHSHLPVVDSCVRATKAELSPCNTHTKPKLFPVWPFKEKVSSPVTWQSYAEDEESSRALTSQWRGQGPGLVLALHLHEM